MIVVPDFRKYLELDTCLEKREHRFCLVSRVLDELMQGKNGTQEWKAAYAEICGRQMLAGRPLAEESTNDEILLEHILASCDSDILAMIIDKYGKGTELGRRISKLYQVADDSKLNSVSNVSQESFYQLLTHMIKEKGYATDADYYNKLCFSRQTFSRLRAKDYVLSRENALWLTLGLAPRYQEGVRLLNAAGYALRSAVRRDYIISYVMKSGKYSLYELNCTLVDFGEEPVGCK